MAPAVAAPPRTDGVPDENVEHVLRDNLPSWLASLVAHLSLVLLLALLVVGDGSLGRGGIALDVALGVADGAGDGADPLEDAIAMPSELSAPPIANPNAESVETIENELVEQPEIKSPEIPTSVRSPEAVHSALVGAGAGLGQGHAKGDDRDDGGIGLAPVRTQVFGVAGEGTDFVYVFDRSESMNSVLSYTSEGTTVFSITPLDAAKAELLRSLDDLQARHRFGIVFYNHSPWLFTLEKRSQAMLAATSNNKQRAASFVASVYGYGKTQHVKPLEIALRMRPDVIFLLTDGEEKDDPSADQLQQLRRLNDGRTRINVVQFCFRPRSGGALVQLAEENGGRHIFFNITRLGPKMPGMEPQPPP